MSPSKVVRERVARLTDLPNIGVSLAGDLQLLGIDRPEQLRSRDPYAMYESLCAITRVRHDPCVLDVFISVTRFMSGEPAADWWAFTDERKRALVRSVSAPR